MSVKLMVATIGTFLAVEVAHAVILPITTDSQITLGDGVDPVTGQRFNPCVQFDPNNVQAEDLGPDNPSSRQTKLDVEQITSYQDFDRYTNSSISGSANYYGAGGSFSYAQESQYTMHSDQAALGISDEADYGRWFLKEVTLKPEYAALAKKNPKEFYKQCGSEYVAGYVRGQGIRILLTTEKNSVYSYDRIQASLHAAYNGGVVGGSLDGAYADATKELIKNGMLRIHFFSYGSGEMKSTEALIRNKEDINAYRETLADLVRGMQASQAVKISYITRTYPGVVGDYDPILAEHRKQTFDILYADYRRLYDTRKRMGDFMGPGFEDVINRQCVDDYKQWCVDYVQSVEKIAKDVDHSIEIVDQLAMRCAQGHSLKDCRLPTISEVNLDLLSQIQWPTQFRYALYLQMLKDIRDRHP